jgi:4-hydroxymandelate oxidase
MSTDLSELVNLDDFERAALPRLAAGPRGYYVGGAEDEQTLRANRSAWSDWCVHYRVLRDVSDCDPATNLLGQRLEWPVMLAPTAYHRLAHDDGEVATARGAAATGTAMVLSTLSNCPMEDVARAATPGLWFQLYVYRDRGVTRELIRRALAAGCRAIAVTVDAPIAGRRERDFRNQFTFPSHLPMRNLSGAGSDYSQPRETDGGFMGYLNRMFDPALTWRDLEWLVAESPLPVLVKGVVRPDDAVLAQRHGARGVIVSNHGGRQLDGSPATARVLGAIARALAEAGSGRDPAQMALLVDGGIRRGVDVLRALALGADAVLIGRPVLWGLALAGEAGVRRMLELLRHEFMVAMALAGCSSIAEISRDLVVDPDQA